MSKIENGGLHQYGAEPFERQQFGTAGVERVNEARSGRGQGQEHEAKAKCHKARASSQQAETEAKIALIFSA